MSLLLYNDDTMVLMNFCTCTYSPHKISYIITSKNVPSFSASAVTVFLSFINTNNIYGYLVTPLSRCHYTITISPPILQLPFYVTHFNIYYTSPTYYLCKRKLPSKTVSRRMTYLYPFNPIYILRLCPTFPESHIISLSLSHA